MQVLTSKQISLGDSGFYTLEAKNNGRNHWTVRVHDTTGKQWLQQTAEYLEVVKTLNIVSSIK